MQFYTTKNNKYNPSMIYFTVLCLTCLKKIIFMDQTRGDYLLSAKKVKTFLIQAKYYYTPVTNLSKLIHLKPVFLSHRNRSVEMIGSYIMEYWL